MAQFATLAAINGNGTVFAVTAQGVSRVLKVGDELQKGETVRTVGDVRVELLMEDGQLLAVAPAQTVRLDDNVVESDQRPTAQDSAIVTPATADTIIQALERGTDLNQVLDPTAAGPGAAGGADDGSTFVQLLRIAEGVSGLTYNYGFAPVDVPPTVVAQSVIAPVGEATITIGTVAGDNIVNNVESGQMVQVAGNVGGSAHAGDIVTLTIGAVVVGSGVVAADGSYTIAVPGSILAGQTVTASVSGADTAGKAYSASVEQPVGADSASATITVNPVTTDNVINNVEANQHVAVTGHVGGNAHVGDTVTLMVGTTQIGTGTVDVNGNYSISVLGNAVAGHAITASVSGTNAAGSTYSAGVTNNVGAASASASITINNVTADNIINNVEVAQTVQVSGSVGGSAHAGDTVTLMVGTTVLGTGTVAVDGSYSIGVAGSALAGQTITASVSGHDTAGSAYSASADQAVAVDMLTAHIAIDPITGDNIINNQEVLAVSITITGTVGGSTTSSVNVGEIVTLTVNGNTYHGTVASDMTYKVEGVAMSDLVVGGVAQQIGVSVTMTDVNGSQATATASTVPGLDTPSASITVNAVTTDNVINNVEVNQQVAVTGHVGGNAHLGDTVTLMVGATQIGSGTVDASGNYSINVLAARWPAKRSRLRSAARTLRVAPTAPAAAAPSALTPPARRSRSTPSRQTTSSTTSRSTRPWQSQVALAATRTSVTPSR